MPADSNSADCERTSRILTALVLSATLGISSPSLFHHRFCSFLSSSHDPALVSRYTCWTVKSASR